MPSIALYQKDPNAAVPFAIDFTRFLPEGETVGSVAWTAASGLTVDGSSVEGNVATVVLSGGTAGLRYRVTARVTTDPSAYVDDRSFHVDVTER